MQFHRIAAPEFAPLSVAPVMVAHEFSRAFAFSWAAVCQIEYYIIWSAQMQPEALVFSNQTSRPTKLQPINYLKLEHEEWKWKNL